MPACAFFTPRRAPAAVLLPSLHSTVRAKPSSVQIPQNQPPYPSTITTHDTTPMPVGDASAFAGELDRATAAGQGSAPAPMSTRAQRRYRRRKKRRKSGASDDEEDMDEDVATMDSLIKGWRSLKAERSGYLTCRQEAVFSRYIQEEALLERANTPEYSSSLYGHGDGDGDGGTASGKQRQSKRDKAVLRARESRERIILSYKRLVSSVASAYQGKGLPHQDVIQEGCIGLLRGAQKFDHRKGYKLSTYVYWWIKQAIVRAIVNKSRLVRLPGNLCEAMNKVIETKSLLKRRFGRGPTYEEIADYLDMSVSNVQIILERSRHPISIDQPVNNERMALKDIIQGPDETRPEAMVARQMMLQNLEQLLKTLSTREELIIRLHYGLNGETAKSFDEIGRRMNLSRERIRQLHWMALDRLRENKNSIEYLWRTPL